MKILLLGDTGKLGTAITEKLVDSGHEIIGLNRSNFELSEIEGKVAENKPDCVINCIAMLGIDNNEVNYADAMVINAMFPKKLAELSVKYEFRLIHFSTELVFGVDSPAKDNVFYSESDYPSPINVYGGTKFLAEGFIRAIASDYIIIRLPLLYGIGGKREQFIDKMVNKLKNGETVNVAEDVYTTPTYTRDIAYVLDKILDNCDTTGILHFSNSGLCNLHVFVCRLKEKLELPGTVNPISCNDIPTIGMKRPYTPLASGRLNPPRYWQQAQDDYMERLRQSWTNT